MPRLPKPPRASPRRSAAILTERLLARWRKRPRRPFDDEGGAMEPVEPKRPKPTLEGGAAEELTFED